jgi:hypothetical protein
MKKFKFDRYEKNSTFYMTDKNYAFLEKDLEAIEKRCKERTFGNADTCLNELYNQVLKHIKFFKDEENNEFEYIVDLYASNESYPKSCKYTMQCTKCKFIIKGKKIIFLSAFRMDTDHTVCCTKDANAIYRYLAETFPLTTNYITIENYRKFKEISKKYVEDSLSLHGIVFYIVR